MKVVSLLVIIRAYAGIAQLVEHLIRNEGVAGSNPVSGTINKKPANAGRIIPTKFFRNFAGQKKPANAGFFYLCFLSNSFKRCFPRSRHFTYVLSGFSANSLTRAL